MPIENPKHLKADNVLIGFDNMQTMNVTDVSLAGFDENVKSDFHFVEGFRLPS